MRSFIRVVAVLALCSCSPPPDPGPPPPPASAGRFTIECSERGVRAYDASRTVIDGVPIDCTVRLGLLHGEPAVGRQLSVLVEAGRFTLEPATSAAGVAALRLETGVPLPVDVEPVVFSHAPLDDATHTGELVAPMWMTPYEWTESFAPGAVYSLREPRRPDPVRVKPDGTRYQNNPRDNLVTIMAWADGEEAFVDVNGNGTYDPGEAFTDLTEPFLDVDDDGTRGPEEQFVDTDGNGQWDGKNGQWDAQTKIWTQQRVLWTGVPAAQDVQKTVQGVTGHRPTVSALPSTIALRCPSGSTMCSRAGDPDLRPLQVVVGLSDPWFNRLAHEEPGNGCSLSNSPLVVLSTSRLELSRSDVWEPWQFFPITIGDARTEMTPRRTPPESFIVTFTCDLSGRRGAQPEQLVFAGLEGTIE